MKRFFLLVLVCLCWRAVPTAAFTHAFGFDEKLQEWRGSTPAVCSALSPRCDMTDTPLLSATAHVGSYSVKFDSDAQEEVYISDDTALTNGTFYLLRAYIYIENSPTNLPSGRPIMGLTMGSDFSCYVRLDSKSQPTSTPSITILFKNESTTGSQGFVTTPLSRNTWHAVEIRAEHADQTSGSEAVECQLYVDDSRKNPTVGSVGISGVDVSFIDGWWVGTRCIGGTCSTEDNSSQIFYADDIVVDSGHRCEDDTNQPCDSGNNTCTATKTCDVDVSDARIGVGGVYPLYPNSDPNAGVGDYDCWDSSGGGGCTDGNSHLCMDDWTSGGNSDGDSTRLGKTSNNVNNCGAGGACGCHILGLTTAGYCTGTGNDEIACVIDADCPATETCDTTPTAGTWNTNFRVRAIHAISHFRMQSGNRTKTLKLVLAEDSTATGQLDSTGVALDASDSDDNTNYEIREWHTIHHRSTAGTKWQLAEIQTMHSGIRQTVAAGSTGGVRATAQVTYLELRAPTPPAFSNCVDWDGDGECTLSALGSSTTKGTTIGKCVNNFFENCTFNNHCVSVSGKDNECLTDADCCGNPDDCPGDCVDSCPETCRETCTSNSDCDTGQECKQLSFWGVPTGDKYCMCDSDSDCDYFGGTADCQKAVGKTWGVCDCGSVSLGNACGDSGVGAGQGVCTDDRCSLSTSYPGIATAAMDQLDNSFNCGQAFGTISHWTESVDNMAQGRTILAGSQCQDHLDEYATYSLVPLLNTCTSGVASVGCAYKHREGRRCFLTGVTCDSNWARYICSGGGNTCSSGDDSDCPATETCDVDPGCRQCITGGAPCEDDSDCDTGNCRQDWCAVPPADLLTIHIGSNDGLMSVNPTCELPPDDVFFSGDTRICSGGTSAGMPCVEASDCTGGGTCSDPLLGCPMSGETFGCTETVCTDDSDCSSLAINSKCEGTCTGDDNVSCHPAGNICSHLNLGTCSTTTLRCTCPSESVSCTTDAECWHGIVMPGAWSNASPPIKRFQNRQFRGICAGECSASGDACDDDTDCPATQTCDKECRNSGVTECGTCSGDSTIRCFGDKLDYQCQTGLCTTSGNVCGEDADCPATQTCGACEDTLTSCTTDGDCDYCQGGRNDGAVCTNDSDCLGDDPPAAQGSTNLTVGVEIDDGCSCVGGPYIGLACAADSDCPSSTCQGRGDSCPGSTNNTAMRGEELDDPCFWQSDLIPELAQVCATTKRSEGGRVECYWYPSMLFAGYATGFTDEANNCDVDQVANEMATTDRSGSSGDVLVHSMPIVGLTNAPARTLTDTEYNNKIQGICVGVVSGTTRYFVTDQTDNKVHEINVTNGTTVNSWSYIGSCSSTHTTDCTGDPDCPATETCDLILTDAEGIACDDDYQRIYVCDDNLDTEGCVAYSYAGAPVKICDSSPWAECTDDSDCSGSCVIAEFGCASANGCPLDDDVLEADAEGVALYKCGADHGYIVVADQRETLTQSQFEVFQRQPPYDHLCTFTLQLASEWTNDTDGIDIAQTTAFDVNGTFMACDDCNPVNGDQYPDETDFIDWEDIATACGLDKCPGGNPYTAIDVDGVGTCSTAGTDCLVTSDCPATETCDMTLEGGSTCGEYCQLGLGHCETRLCDGGTVDDSPCINDVTCPGGTCGGGASYSVAHNLKDWWRSYGATEMRPLKRYLLDSARASSFGKAIDVSFNHFHEVMCHASYQFGVARAGRFYHWGASPIELMRKWMFEDADMIVDFMRMADYADSRWQLAAVALAGVDDSTLRTDQMHPNAAGASVAGVYLTDWLQQLDFACIPTMWPDGDTSVKELSIAGSGTGDCAAGAHYGCVNDFNTGDIASSAKWHDGSSTVVWTTNDSTWRRELYDLSPPPTGMGENNVKYIRVAISAGFILYGLDDATLSEFRVLISNGKDIISGRTQKRVGIKSLQFGDWGGEVWHTNPWTQKEWTRTDLVNLQAGVELITHDSAAEIRVTALRVEIREKDFHESEAMSCRRCEVDTDVSCLIDGDCASGICSPYHGVCPTNEKCIDFRWGKRCDLATSAVRNELPVCNVGGDCANFCSAARCSSDPSRPCQLPAAGHFESVSVDVDGTVQRYCSISRSTTCADDTDCPATETCTFEGCNTASREPYFLNGGENWCVIDGGWLGLRCSNDLHRGCAADSDCEAGGSCLTATVP